MIGSAISGLFKARVSMAEVNIAEKADVLNAGEQLKRKAGEAFRRDAASAIVRMHINTFQIDRIFRLRDDVCFEDHRFTVFDDKNAILLDPSGYSL